MKKNVRCPMGGQLEGRKEYILDANASTPEFVPRRGLAAVSHTGRDAKVRPQGGGTRLCTGRKEIQ